MCCFYNVFLFYFISFKFILCYSFKIQYFTLPKYENWNPYNTMPVHQYSS